MNIALIDEHRFFTESLQLLIHQESEQHQVAIFNSGATFLGQASPQTLPDVLVTGLHIAGISGIKFIEICTNLYRDHGMKIIVLSAATDVQTIKQCIQAGANGFLSKNTPFRELIVALSEICAGNQYIGRSLRNSLLNHVFIKEQINFLLSSKELEVLHKVCGGQTIKEIAFDMRLSTHTTQYHKRNILRKLNLKHTSDLIVYAMQHGLYIPDATSGHT